MSASSTSTAQPTSSSGKRKVASDAHARAAMPASCEEASADARVGLVRRDEHRLAAFRTCGCALAAAVRHRRARADESAARR